MTRKCPVRFGGGRMEKDAAGYPSRLTHTGSRTPASDGTSPAAYPTRIISNVKPFIEEKRGTYRFLHRLHGLLANKALCPEWR